MLVELGNHGRLNPIDDKPAVTYVNIPDDYTLADGLNVEDFRRHLGDSLLMNKPTNCPDHEAALVIPGAWAEQSTEQPAWVSCEESPELARIISEFYQIPAERPGLFEDLYWRQVGSQQLIPGVPASAAVELDGLLTNAGRVFWGQALGGHATAGQYGVATAATSTTLSISGLTASAWIGAVVYVADSSGNHVVWGNVLSNTTSALTVDQWYNNAGAAASTPAGGYQYMITWAVQPAWYMALSSTNFTPAATDVSLGTQGVEVTANGLGRRQAAYLFTSGTSSPATYTLQATYSYSGSSAVTIYVMGLFNSLSPSTGTMVFETALNASATVNTSGDNIQVTETVTGS